MNRLAPDHPLPPYAYLPGVNVHPAHAGGHSFGHAPDPPIPLDPLRWRECATYLYGLDLFNCPAPPLPGSPEGRFAYYWEAHEGWGGLWEAAGRRGEVADFLKGLIHLAVAGLKQRQALPHVAQTHARRAAELWRGVHQERLLGFSVGALVALADAVARDGWPAEPP